MVNKVQILGHLGQDPELRRNRSGAPVASIRIATTERRRGRDGKWTPHTEWHNVVFFGALAESLCEYCRRGRQLYIEGRLRTREVRGIDGEPYIVTEIVAEGVRFLGPVEGGYADFGGERRAEHEEQTLGDHGARYRNLSRFRRAS